MPDPTLLLCLDLEAGSDALVAYAAKWARRCHASIHALHVRQAPWDDRGLKEAEERLHALIDAPLKGIPTAIQLESGTPEDWIVKVAAACQADPILLGRRRRTTVERIYVGSTTSAVIALAQRPVLVVPL